MLKRLSRDEAAPAKAAEPGFDLLEIIGFAWRRWKFIAGVTTLALLLGLIHLARQTPLYTAATQVLLDVKRAAPSKRSLHDG